MSHLNPQDALLHRGLQPSYLVIHSASRFIYGIEETLCSQFLQVRRYRVASADDVAEDQLSGHHIKHEGLDVPDTFLFDNYFNT